MICLVREWLASPQRLIDLTGRVDWLLDGWAPLAALWESATDDPSRRAILSEIVLLAPALPKEAAEWGSTRISQDALLRARRSVRLNEDWRGLGTPMDLIARNERLLAHAA